MAKSLPQRWTVFIEHSLKHTFESKICWWNKEINDFESAAILRVGKRFNSLGMSKLCVVHSQQRESWGPDSMTPNLVARDGTATKLELHSLSRHYFFFILLFPNPAPSQRCARNTIQKILRTMSLGEPSSDGVRHKMRFASCGPYIDNIGSIVQKTAPIMWPTQHYQILSNKRLKFPYKLRGDQEYVRFFSKFEIRN